MPVLEFTPVDLGMPPKFTNYRNGQLDLALEIAASSARHSFLSAPPGSGKSAIAATIAMIRGGRTLYLTASKSLQSQLYNEFESVGLVQVMGQSNYPCVAVRKGGALEGFADPDASCEQGPCRNGVACALRSHGCGYYDAVNAAKGAKLVVANYALWLSATRHSDPELLGKFDMLVCDEAHQAPSWLVNFCAVELYLRKIEQLVGRDVARSMPQLDDGLDLWARWARQSSITAAALIDTNREQLLDSALTDDERRALNRELLALTQLKRGFDELSLAQTWRSTEGSAKDVRLPGQHVDWIGYKVGDGASDEMKRRSNRLRARDVAAVLTDSELGAGIRWSPIWAHAYAEQYLFRSIPKVLLMSGTMMPSIVGKLGVKRDESDWYEAKSAFPSRRRPVIYSPAVGYDSRSGEVREVYVDRRMTDAQLTAWIDHIDAVLETRLDRKVLIHSVSYDRAFLLAERSKFGHHMIAHDERGARAAIERFRAASAPAILVSPSMVEGVDFPFEQLRCVIVAKVPFASATDPVFKARCKADPMHRFEEAARTIIQMCGRGMRDERDWCESVICDAHFGYMRWKVRWPQWFKMAWQESVGKAPRAMKVTA